MKDPFTKATNHSKTSFIVRTVTTLNNSSTNSGIRENGPTNVAVF
jgi:hypothetical protein